MINFVLIYISIIKRHKIISVRKRLCSSMHDAGCLGLVHWDDPVGWFGVGGGRRVQDGEHMRNKGIKNLKIKKN